MTKAKSNLKNNNKDRCGSNVKKNINYNTKKKHHDQEVVLNAKQLKRREYAKKRKEKETLIRQPIICKYFLYGSCKLDDCAFSHNVNADQMMKFDQPCKYYSVGECTKGKMCCFLHETFPCLFFHNKAGNRCKKAENCLFSHDPLTPEMKVALEKYIDFQKNRGNDSSIINHEPETAKSIQVDFGKSIIISKNNEGAHPISENNNKSSLINVSFGKNCLFSPKDVEKKKFNETVSEKSISSDESDKGQEDMEATPRNVTVNVNNDSIISKRVPVSSFTNLFNQHNYEDSDTAEEPLMETKSSFENENHLSFGESFQNAKTYEKQKSKDNLNILESLASNLNNIPTFTKLFDDSDSEDELKICENSSTRQSMGSNTVNAEVNIVKQNNVYSTSFPLNNNGMIKVSQSHINKSTVEKLTVVTETAVDFSYEGRYPLRKRMSSSNSMNGPAVKINKTCEKAPLKNNFNSTKINIENVIETERSLYNSQPDLSVKKQIISNLLSKRKITEVEDSVFNQNKDSSPIVNKCTNFDEERLAPTKYTIFGSDSENDYDESKNINRIELQQKNEEFSIPEFDWSEINQRNMFSGTNAVLCPDSDDDINVEIKTSIEIAATKKTSSCKLKHKRISSNKKEIKLIQKEKQRKDITMKGELKTNEIKSQQVLEETPEFDWSGINQESMFSIAPVLYPDSDDDIKAGLKPKDEEAIDRSNTKKSSLKFEQKNISSESHIKHNGNIKVKESKLKSRGSNSSIKKTKSKRISKIKSKLTPSIIDTDSDYQNDEFLEDRIQEESRVNGFSVKSKESNINIDKALKNPVLENSAQKQSLDRISKMSEKLMPSLIDTDLDCLSNVRTGSSNGKSIKRCKKTVIESECSFKKVTVPTIKKSCTKVNSRTNLVFGELPNSDLFSFSSENIVPLPPIAYPDSDNDDVIRTVSRNTSSSHQDDRVNQTNNNRMDLAANELPNSELFSFSSGNIVPLPTITYPDSDNDDVIRTTSRNTLQSQPEDLANPTNKDRMDLAPKELPNSDLFSFSSGNIVPLPSIAYPDSDNDDVIRTDSMNTSSSHQDDMVNQTNNNRMDLAPKELPNSDFFSFSAGNTIPLPSFVYPDSDNDETTHATPKEAMQPWADHTPSQASVLTVPNGPIDPQLQDHDAIHQSTHDDWAPVYLDLPPKLQYHEMDIDCYNLSHKFYDPRLYNHPKALKPNWADWLSSR